MRIVSLNTWKCEGNYRHRVRLMERGLAALKPDVVCLQECFSCVAAEVNTASALGAATGMSVLSVEARRKARDFEGASTVSSSGLAILTRGGIVDSGVLTLPSNARDGDRLALFADLPVASRLLRVVCTHLTHLSDEALRAQQARALLALDDGRADAVIVAGDLNAGLDSPALAALRVRCQRGTEGQTATPTYIGEAAARGEQVWSRKGRRIDHLLLLTGPDAGRLSRPRTVLTRPDSDGVYPSDHTGVFARWHPGTAVDGR